MAWGALVGDLRKKHHPDTDLATLNLIVGLFNFVSATSIPCSPKGRDPTDIVPHTDLVRLRRASMLLRSLLGG